MWSGGDCCDQAWEVGHQDGLREAEEDTARDAADEACFEFVARYRHLTRLERVMVLTTRPSQS